MSALGLNLLVATIAAGIPTICIGATLRSSEDTRFYLYLVLAVVVVALYIAGLVTA